MLAFLNFFYWDFWVPGFLKQLKVEMGSLNTDNYLDYLIAVDYQINVALGIFPEINKRRLLNNCSLGKNLKRLINISLLTSKNMLISLVVYSS